MKIIEQSHKILMHTGIEMLEKAGRTCYQSQDKIGCIGKTRNSSVDPCGRINFDSECHQSDCKDHSSQRFVKMLRDRGHHAMIEFGDITVKFITNRGITHELVRHRHCSFAQESTRYVKYDGEMEFIRPVWWDTSKASQRLTWEAHMKDSEFRYKTLLETGWKAQQAREILPNSLKTEIVVKANFREFSHILNLRCNPKAHPQMAALMRPLLIELHEKIPMVFDLLYKKYIKEA